MIWGAKRQHVPHASIVLIESLRYVLSLHDNRIVEASLLLQGARPQSIFINQAPVVLPHRAPEERQDCRRSHTRGRQRPTDPIAPDPGPALGGCAPYPMPHVAKTNMLGCCFEPGVGSFPTL